MVLAIQSVTSFASALKAKRFKIDLRVVVAEVLEIYSFKQVFKISSFKIPLPFF